jgi:hypothetical protein
MIERISSPVSVTLIYNHKQRKVAPKWVIWEGKQYLVIRIGLHHTYKAGTILFHVFSVESESLFFRLVLNTTNLHWTLEEISDGEPD